MYSGKPLKAHIELSNKCNAMCPQCGRNTAVSGTLKLQPGMQTTELRLEDIERIFDDEFWTTHQLDNVRFVGNYSDPIATKDLHEIVEFFIFNNPKIQVTISTNGSLKTEDWWYHFGSMFNDKHRRVVFALDGTDNITHALYRHRTNYDKIIRNAKSFISAGGNAEWSFLVFKHNEHQLEEAKRLSEEYGFKKFLSVYTTRFHNGKGYKKYKLDGGKSFLAFLFCFVIFFLSFIFPSSQMLYWTIIYSDNLFDLEVLSLIYNTLYLVFLSSLALIIFSFISNYGMRVSKSKPLNVMNTLSISGYAIPGVILAIAFITFIAWFDNNFVKLFGFESIKKGIN